MFNGPQKRLAVYTVILNDYDLLREPHIRNEGIDFICFTDNLTITSEVWNIVPIPKEVLSEQSAFKISRKLKIFPHLYLTSYDSSLYIDGNIELIDSLYPWFHVHERNEVISVARHPERNCSFKEAEECAARGYVKISMVARQMRRYKVDLPVNYGLGELNIILRKHDCAALHAAMQDWWDEVSTKSERDQLSFIWAMKKNQISVSFLNSEKDIKGFFFKHQHKILKNQEAQSRENPIIYKLMYHFRKLLFKVHMLYPWVQK